MAATFVPGDFTVVLKEMSAFAKTHKQLEFKGGWVEARAFDAAQVAALATIPPREQLLGMLVSVLNAPLSQLVGTLQAVPRDLVLTLMSVAEKKGGRWGGRRGGRRRVSRLISQDTSREEYYEWLSLPLRNSLPRSRR